MAFSCLIKYHRFCQAQDGLSVPVVYGLVHIRSTSTSSVCTYSSIRDVPVPVPGGVLPVVLQVQVLNNCCVAACRRLTDSNQLRPRHVPAPGVDIIDAPCCRRLCGGHRSVLGIEERAPCAQTMQRYLVPHTAVRASCTGTRIIRAHERGIRKGHLVHTYLVPWYLVWPIALTGPC